MLITGSIPALITPFDTNEKIDRIALERLINWHIEQGSAALVIAGTTGESATINVEEHTQLIVWSVEYVAKRIPIIAGTGANSTSEALELTQAAKDVAADACLLVSPYYNKPTQEGLYRHFKCIAEKVDIPQILYNVPSRTASDILPETVGRLAKIPNIIGIKDTQGLERLRELQQVVDKDFSLLTGEDPEACEFILAGGCGGVSVTANIAPKLNAEMYALALAGKKDEARAINARLKNLHRDLFIQSNPIPVKYAAFRLGCCENILRLPMTTLEEQYYAAVDQAMADAGVI